MQSTIKFKDGLKPALNMRDFVHPDIHIWSPLLSLKSPLRLAAGGHGTGGVACRAAAATDTWRGSTERTSPCRTDVSRKIKIDWSQVHRIDCSPLRLSRPMQTAPRILGLLGPMDASEWWGPLDPSMWVSTLGMIDVGITFEKGGSFTHHVRLCCYCN